MQTLHLFEGSICAGGGGLKLGIFERFCLIAPKEVGLIMLSARNMKFDYRQSGTVKKIPAEGH